MGIDSYQALAEIPVYTAASFLKSSEALSVIKVTSSVSDHLRNVKRTLEKTVVVTPEGSFSSPANDAADCVASALSPSGRFQVALREGRGDDGQKKRYVEIWEADSLVVQKDVTKVHDEFYTDALFSSLSFSPSEAAVIWTAEAKGDQDSSHGKGANYEKFKFRPHYGEKLFGRKRPTIYIMRWETDAKQQSESVYQPVSTANIYAVAPALPEGHVPVSFGQAVFGGEGVIYATGYEYTADGRALGPVGCFNRPAGIWSLELPPSVDSQVDQPVLTCVATRLSDKNRSCRSPRVIRVKNSVDSAPTSLVWLSHEVYGPHHSCAQLNVYDIKKGTSGVLVDTVSAPSSKDAFPGLYIEQLPDHLTVSLKTLSFVIIQSVWGCANHIVLISLDNGSVHKLTPEEMDGVYYTWSLLATDGRQNILCARSSLNCPNQLLLGVISKDLPYSVKWTIIDTPAVPQKLTDMLKTLSVTIHSLPARKPVQTIVVKPMLPNNENRILPLVTFPHGGPHTATSTGFVPLTVALALAGYTVSMPNYTGSLGYGEKAVKALVGNAGTLDIDDCKATIQHLVDIGIAKEGAGYQFILGGSHGGFIGAHLIGRYPTFFSGAALRNPVIAAGEMSTTTDIPDWCYSEFDLPFGPQSALDTTIFTKLQAASPIAHIDAILSPVLLLVGDKDQRVPPSQGRNFYHALKGRGKIVEMLWFPGAGHSLDSVEAARGSWEAVQDWFATGLLRRDKASRGGCR